MIDFPGNAVEQIRQLVYEYKQEVVIKNMLESAKKEEKLINWCCPPMGWVNINTDGALQQTTGCAIAAGLIHDAQGKWHHGFVYNLEICSIIQAEAWGVIIGLQRTCELGMKQVIIECDSKLVVDAILNPISVDTMHEPIISSIQQWMLREWEVRITHIYREANMCTDWLTKFAYQTPLGLHILDQCSRNLFQFLFSDVVGVAWPRTILI